MTLGILEFNSGKNLLVDFGPVDVAVLTPLIEEWEEMTKHLATASDVRSWSPVGREP